MASWVGLQYVIMVFPDHSHLFFYHIDTNAQDSKLERNFNPVVTLPKISIFNPKPFLSRRSLKEIG